MLCAWKPTKNTRVLVVSNETKHGNKDRARNGLPVLAPKSYLEGKFIYDYFKSFPTRMYTLETALARSHTPRRLVKQTSL